MSMSYRSPNILGSGLFTSANEERTAIDDHNHQDECAGIVRQPRGWEKAKAGGNKVISFSKMHCSLRLGTMTDLVIWSVRRERGDLGE